MGKFWIVSEDIIAGGHNRRNNKLYLTNNYFQIYKFGYASYVKRGSHIKSV